MTEVATSIVHSFAAAAFGRVPSYDDPLRYALVCEVKDGRTRYWFELKDWPNESARVVDAEQKMLEAWRETARYRDRVKVRDDRFKPRPYAEWSEDDGDALWFKSPIEEPPYCGRPDDDGFPYAEVDAQWVPLPPPFVKNADA